MGKSSFQGHFDRAFWKMQEPSFQEAISHGGISGIIRAAKDQGASLGPAPSPPSLGASHTLEDRATIEFDNFICVVFISA